MKKVKMNFNNLESKNHISIFNNSMELSKEVLYTDGDAIKIYSTHEKIQENRRGPVIDYFEDIYSIDNASYIVKAHYDYDSEGSSSIIMGLSLQYCDIFIKSKYEKETLKKIKTAIYEANQAEIIKNNIPISLCLFENSEYGFDDEINNKYLKRGCYR